MDRMDFIQSVIRTRVLEKKLLSRARIDRLIEAKDMEEVYRILGETEYATIVSETKREEDYENILSAELEKTYTTMREISPHQNIVDLMALKYDYHNLKIMVKENKLKTDLSELYSPVATTDIKGLKEDYLEGDYRDMAVEFKEALQNVEEDFETNNDPQRIDLILDRYYFRHLYKMAEETGIDLFTDYVRDMIDFINIRSSIRLKRQEKDITFFENVIISNGNIDKEEILFTLNDSTDNMIHKFRNYRISKELLKGLEAYKETGRLSDLEKYMDNYLMGLNIPSKNVHFGPEPIFSFIYAKETEIKVLRIIMVSKLNNISPDAIRGRVRDLYV